MSDLLAYAKAGDPAALLDFLQSGGVYDAREVDFESRSTALHFLLSKAEACACDKCQATVAKCTSLLMDASSDVNWRNEAGHLPLELAITNGWTESALLISNKADLTIRLANGEPLAKLLARTNPDIFCKLLDHDVPGEMNAKKSSKIDVDFRNVVQYSGHGYYNELMFIRTLHGDESAVKVLEHPVVQLFLRIKYQKGRWFVLQTLFHGFYLKIMGWHFPYVWNVFGPCIWGLDLPGAVEEQNDGLNSTESTTEQAWPK